MCSWIILCSYFRSAAVYIPSLVFLLKTGRLFVVSFHSLYFKFCWKICWLLLFIANFQHSTSKLFTSVLMVRCLVRAYSRKCSFASAVCSFTKLEIYRANENVAHVFTNIFTIQNFNNCHGKNTHSRWKFVWLSHRTYTYFVVMTLNYAL